MILYCNKYFNDSLKIVIDLELFITDFMKSDLMAKRERGSYFLFLVDYKELFELYLDTDLKGDYSKYVKSRVVPKKDEVFGLSSKSKYLLKNATDTDINVQALAWSLEAYNRLGYVTGIKAKSLLEVLPLSSIRRHYGHGTYDGWVRYLTKVVSLHDLRRQDGTLWNWIQKGGD